MSHSGQDTNRVFAHPSQYAELSKRPHFDYSASLVGSTFHFHVYSAKSLHTQGTQVGHAVLAKVESDYAQLLVWFGVTPPAFNVILAPLSPGHDGTGGAYHHTCLDSNLYCDVRFHPSVNSDFSSALVIAEEVEVFEAVQSKGWDCGGSNGEGLSRVLAEALYPGILDDYATAPSWLDSNRPDWVNQTNGTDTDPVSNGCAVLFLHWLHTKLGHDWGQVCKAASPTLAGTYAILTGKPAIHALIEFTTAINALFPPGTPSGLTKDNPF